MQQSRHQAETTEEDSGAVDKIRAILFGEQMQGYEQRFVALESRLNSEIQRATASMTLRIDQLENTFSARINTLDQRLAQETRERMNAASDLHLKLEQAVRELRESIDSLAQRSAQERQRHTDLLATLGDQVAGLQAGSQSLADSKVSRSELASFFSQLSAQLSDNPDT